MNDKLKKKNNNTEFENIVLLIQDARIRAFAKVNAELVLLYFKVGDIISAKVSEGVWGDGTVDELAAFIQKKIPGLSGFNRRGLYRMKQFYETYTVEEFVSPLATYLQTYLKDKSQSQFVSAVSTQIQKEKKVSKGGAQKPAKNAGKLNVSAVPTHLDGYDSLHNQFVSEVLTQIAWSSHMELLSQTKTPEEKLFYILLSIKEKWSMRELRRQLKSASFERTMMSNKFVSSVQTQIPHGIFKDPYIFEFLNLPEGHSEKDLEKSLIKNLQKFILEVGKGFTYMGNQYRLQVGNKDYYTDLLFYHRDLQCLVLFELKIQEFEPEFLGKLNFYLEALDKDVKRPFEKASIGVLLCKGRDTEVVEYAMARNISPALVADYETKLIPKRVLANKLHQLVEQLSKENID
ncbi:MAG: DUF1016 family protein [Bacteroidetes bacterium]|nr:DUF1016 family protein [Bacteroidota bacterium]MBS1610881.1 DUF1016 family protein [Bacteroidota bacterium]